jgi:hypothetical protein
MNGQILENIQFYIDNDMLAKKEPGIYHSFMSSLATALNFIGQDFDPVWLMGTSAFAFRIFTNEILCPSAMSMFSFREVLPESIEQSGYNSIYIERMWGDLKLEKEKRAEAHEAIVHAIGKGIPAIVWDIADAEWGLVVGYDDKSKTYMTMTHKGKPSVLPYKKLGKNGIDILSVLILGAPNIRSREEIINNSLNAAIEHAEGKEWIDDRPKYQNGLSAFDLWASIFDKWAWIVNSGKSGNIKMDLHFFARYYAGHYYSARCYARDYLKRIAVGNQLLKTTGLAYEKVANYIEPIWAFFSSQNKPDGSILKSFAENILRAKKYETDAIKLIKKYLCIE